MRIPSRRTRLAVVLAGLALGAAACSSSPSSTPTVAGSSARPTASALPPSPVCNSQMKLVQPANGTRFNGPNGTTLVLKVCGPASTYRFMPIDVDPDHSVTLDYNSDTASGPQFLSAVGNEVVFLDVGVGNLGTIEHMQVGYQPVPPSRCAKFLQSITSPDGDYTTTLTALRTHGCPAPVLAHVTAVNK